MPLTVEIRLREGDIVAVLATVTYAPKRRADTYVHLKVEGSYSPLLLEPRQIEAVVRRAFAVGERVRCDAGAGTILAIATDSAWIKLDGAPKPVTADLNRIELLEPEPVADDGDDPMPPVQPPVAEIAMTET
ncbi:hypothetical protein C3941_19555 [Kaistia algarum]|uniref:hypothetical protein n=1 Tax=Kaistia algarum TaxID=2083279 RepID=UPI000CE91005|nr:hypothetical protein [Kaistia algarum]MCX5516189.1 hypothetical protein [Kaistia algarum]PPE78263.1 hypothetical protein C3941_19555 [Kaistia algarum]